MEPLCEDGTEEEEEEEEEEERRRTCLSAREVTSSDRVCGKRPVLIHGIGVVGAKLLLRDVWKAEEEGTSPLVAEIMKRYLREDGEGVEEEEEMELRDDELGFDGSTPPPPLPLPRGSVESGGRGDDEVDIFELGSSSTKSLDVGLGLWLSGYSAECGFELLRDMTTVG